MTRSLKVRTRIIGGTSAVIAVLFGVALVCMWNIRSDTRTAVYTALSRLTESESGVRGYLVTGNASFRASQARAERALRSGVADLGRLVSRDDDPAVQVVTTLYQCRDLHVHRPRETPLHA